MAFAFGSLSAEAAPKKKTKARTHASAAKAAAGFGFKTIAERIDAYGTKTFAIADDIESRIQKEGFKYVGERSSTLETSDETQVPATVRTYEKDGIRVNYSQSADPLYIMNGLTIDFPDAASRDKFITSAKTLGYKFFTQMKCYSNNANCMGLTFTIDNNSLNFEFVN